MLIAKHAVYEGVLRGISGTAADLGAKSHTEPGPDVASYLAAS